MASTIPNSLLSAGFYGELVAQPQTSVTLAPAVMFGIANADASAAKDTLSDYLTSEAQVIAAYGDGSDLVRMYRAFRAQNPLMRLYAVSVTPPTGTRGHFTITPTVTGTCGIGTFTLRIGTNRANTIGKIQVATVAADTANTICTAIRNAINTYGTELTSGSPVVGHWYEIVKHDSVDFTTAGAAATTVGTVFECTNAGVTMDANNTLREVTSRLPVFAEVLTAGVVCTLHQRHKGVYTSGSFAVGVNTEGVLAGESMPTNLSFAISESAGTGVPSLTNAIAALGDIDLSAILCPFSDSTSLAAVSAEIARRDGYAVAKYGQGFGCYYNATVSTIASLASTLNDHELCLWGAHGNYTPACEALAAATGEFLRVMEIGPQLPVYSYEVGYIMPAPSRMNDYTLAEKEALLEAGVTPFDVTDDASRTVKLGRVRTTRSTDTSGNLTYSYLDAGQTRFCPRAVMLYKRAMLESKYSKCAIVSDTTPISDNQLACTPSAIKADVIGYHDDCVGFGWCQDSDSYAASVTVTIDPSVPGRVHIYDPDIMAAGLNQMYYTLSFGLIA